MANRVIVLGAFEFGGHWGQLEFLARAQQFGEVTVGLTSDALLTATKRQPVFSFDERKEGLERMGFTVVKRDQSNARSLFRKVKPSFFICGNDWLERDHLASAGLDVEFLNELACSVVYTPRNHSMSATKIIDSVKAQIVDHE